MRRGVPVSRGLNARLCKKLIWAGDDGDGGGGSTDSVFPVPLLVSSFSGNPALGQTHGLSTESLLASPVVGSPAIGDTIISDSLTVSPSVGAPAIAQRHAIRPSNINATPSVGTPFVSPQGQLDMSSIVAAVPASQPTLAQVHVFTATGVTSTTSVSSPAINETIALEPDAISASPSIGAPAISQVHPLSPTGITSATSVGTPTVATGAKTITSVVVGSYSNGALPVAITTVEDPDDSSTVYGVIVPTGQTAPSAAQIASGLNGLGTAPLDAFSITWSAGPAYVELVSGIDEACDVYVVIDSGEYSNVESDTNITIYSTPPTIDTFSIGAYVASPSAGLPFNIAATNAEDGVDTVYSVILPHAEPNPTDPRAIKGETVSNALDFLSATFDTGGNTSAIAADIDELCKVAVVIEGAGGFSNIAVFGVYIDSTVPALSSPSGVQTGDTTATLNVTSDEAEGTIYAAVYPTASTPSAADIIAGTGATWTGTDATPTIGANAFSATGLTASTAYKAHFVQVDDMGNQSTASASAEFTTAASSGWEPADDASRIAAWDASDTGSITDTGGNVTALADLVASADMAMTGTPRTGDTTQNGLNAIDFVPDEHMAATVSNLHNSGDLLLVVVANIGAVNGFGDMLVGADATAGNNDWHYEANAASSFMGKMTAVNLGVNTGGTNGPYSGWHVFSFVFEAGGNISVYVDGVLDIQEVYSSNASASHILYFFGGKFAGVNMGGSFGEAHASHDPSARADYETFLTNKWGL